jgi:hypothetical protein
MSETASGNPAPEPYKEMTDPGYATTAAAAFEIDEYEAGALTLRGPCPRCRAEIEIPVVSSIVRGLTQWAGMPQSAARIEPVVCTCEEPHGGRPEGRVGCGAYWNFIL